MTFWRSRTVLLIPAKLAVICAIALIVSIIINLVNFAAFLWSIGHEPSLPKRAYSSTKFPVEFPLAAMITGRSEHYTLSSSANQNWRTITPTLSSGFLFHPSAKKFYAVSLYHQIHCLMSLRRYISRGDGLRLTNDVVSHTEHCLDYLREALLCHADATLEPVHDVFVAPANATGEKPHIDQVAMGWNVTHQCRDWTVLRNYLEENWDSWPEEYKTKSST